MRSPRDTHEPLSPAAERELEAIERALRGQAVDPDLAGLATLVEDLRAERIEPSEEWTRAMDEKAARRFDFAGPWKRARRWVGSHRGQALALASGLTLVVIVGAVIASYPHVQGLSGGSDSAVSRSEGDSVDGELKLYSGEAASVPESAGTADSASGEVSSGAAKPSQRQSRDRKQDRSASLELTTQTGKVREVSDRAIQITEAAGGVVLSSELSERGKRASAQLELSIPTERLDATLDQLTDLATVKSLNEAAVDITEPYVSARDRLVDARAQREKLLEALSAATTEDEAKAIRAQLADVRTEIAKAKAKFDRVARQARLSQVSLAVVGSADDGDDGSWSLGDAADDALSTLKTVAGVLLVAAAILVPIAILAALVVAIWLALRDRRRQRALDD